MPTVKVYPSGLSAGQGGGGARTNNKRGVILGWSSSAVRRHVRWLWSIRAEDLLGFGVALTLTLPDTPGSAVQFHALRRAFIKRLERRGDVLRWHWVIEWTKRKRPHLHLAVYLVDGNEWALYELKHAWLDVARKTYPTTSWAAQYAIPITGALGWLQYLSKHAARGVNHYQRIGHPEGWDRTGRLWGHSDAWPEETPVEADFSREAFFRLRRLVAAGARAEARAARIAIEARAGGDPGQKARLVAAARHRERFTRRMLRCGDRKLSEVRGISQWVSIDNSARVLWLLETEGHIIVPREAA